MSLLFRFVALGCCLVGLCLGIETSLAAQEVLPKPEAPFEGKIARTAKDSKPDFPKGIEAPKGAPNVLLIMTDDVGHDQQNVRSAFGRRQRGRPVRFGLVRLQADHTTELRRWRWEVPSVNRSGGAR